jgi:hypothetical protein
MLDQHFRSAAVPPTDIFGPLDGSERVMWRGRAAVAEYAFEQAGSLPRWTLPQATHVLVTDRRVIYAHAAGERELQITSGELRWLWPQFLRLQPGARSTDRGAAATHIQLVCGAVDGSFPALVFAGGDLKTVRDADKLANVLRHAIARFRVDHASELGLTTPQARMLSRLLIGPEFSNHQGGDGQTVALTGALLVSRPRAALRAEPEVRPHRAPIGAGTRVLTPRPGLAADAQRAWQAAQAEEATQQARPEIGSRVADLAARVASLVSQPDPPVTPAEMDTIEENHFDAPGTHLAERAETLRRSAARLAANAAHSRPGTRRTDRDPGVTSRGNRPG